MNVFVVGGSKNIGYYAALRLLNKGATVTFMLRNTSVFDDDEQMQTFIKSRKAHLVRGDALNRDDVQHAWQAALDASQGTLDFVLFTVGGFLTFTLSQGFALNTHDLCTRALLNLLSTIPAALRPADVQPRFVMLTSMGLDPASHAAVPLLVKPVYSVLLPAPHADKLGMERVLAHCAGRPWAGEEPEKAILPAGWKETPGLLAEGELRHLVIVRPSLLTDGPCKADEPAKDGKPPYRIAPDSELKKAYRVSRMDTAHFIVEEALPNWVKYQGKGVVITY